VHVSAFDLDTCFHLPLELPRPANRQALLGLLSAAHPEVVECLVDPGHRGQAQRTALTLRATVDAEGAEHEALGENLTPGGRACIEQALRLRGSVDPLPDGEVSAELPVLHQVGRDPGVVLGLHPAADAVAQVRLALPRFCDCFDGFRTRAPRSFEGQLELGAPGGPPVQVTFPPDKDDPVTARVQACLAERVGALEFPGLPRPLSTELPVALLHSGVGEPLPSGAPSALAVAQLEAVRLRRSAHVALAEGARVNAADAFSALTRAPKKKARPQEVAARCAELLAADELWIAALEARLETTRRLSALRPDADPAGVEEARSALDAARATRARDAAACPARRM
jgi:hypothetical protein